MLFPAQGQWTEADYLALNGENWIVELSEGCVEFLPMPTISHQDIVCYLFTMLNAFVMAGKLGSVYFAPMPVRLWAGKFREPDVMFFTPGRIADRDKQPEGVDLAMEVVSDDKESRKRDLETKRIEYAAAKIPEYWIIDPKLHQITVLRLEGETYGVHGTFGARTNASSALLPGFEVNVDAVFAAGTQGREVVQS